MIYHIAHQTDWAAAQQAGQYTADSLASQGFIHCSMRAQVLPVSERYYAGQIGLVLLCIAEEKLTAPVRYENLEGGEELFPHIYGPLNLEAVVHAAAFMPGADGKFTLAGCP